MVARPKPVRQEGNRLRRFIETAPAAMAMFDRDMRYIAHSQRFLTEFRLLYTSLIGLSHDTVFPDLADTYSAIHRRCLAGATESAEEERLPRADGSIDWIR